MSLFLTRITAACFSIQSLYNQKWLKQLFKIQEQEHTKF